MRCRVVGAFVSIGRRNMTVAMPCRRRIRDLFVVVAAAGVVSAGARAARRGRWIDAETEVFDAVNGLDQRAQRLAWAAM